MHSAARREPPPPTPRETTPVPQLQPGIYKIRAEAKGFKTVERINIGVEVAQDGRVDVALPPDRFPRQSW